MIKFFRLIWHQTEFRSMPNRSERSNYNPNLVSITEIQKNFLRAWRKKKVPNLGVNRRNFRCKSEGCVFFSVFFFLFYCFFSLLIVIFVFFLFFFCLFLFIFSLFFIFFVSFFFCCCHLLFIVIYLFIFFVSLYCFFHYFFHYFFIVIFFF